MTYHFIKYLKEDKDDREITQDSLSFGKGDLHPVMSKETLDYHYDGLAKKYFERYNAGEGDPKFNYGGAMLHNLFFGNLRTPAAGNKPKELSREIIEEKYKSFDDFKKAFEKEFMAAQGSNWIYMDNQGKLHTIHNHEYKKDMRIVLLIDAWEHAWALDYQQDKAGYLKNIWRIVDWDVVDDRIKSYKER
jgi:Fe-Mn family superoxide dismutase